MATPEPAKLLVVDDNEGNRYALVRSLRQAGHNVLEAATGQECLRLAEDEQPELVLLDIQLPDLSGIEVCRQLKSDPKTAAIPVIQVSAYLTTTDNRIQGLESGADAYLTTPFDPRELLAHVRALVRAAKAEAALRQSEQRLRLALDAASLISFEWDIQRDEVWRQVSKDATLRPTSGQRPDTFERVCQCVHPDDRAQFRTNVQAALKANDGKYVNEFRLLRSDGTVAWLSEQGRVERDHQDRPARLIGLAQDITERKQAEEALRQSEKKYRTLFDSIDEGYFLSEVIFDAAGQPVDILYLEANPAATRMVRQNYVGRRLRQIDSGFEQHWLEVWAKVLRTGKAERLVRYAAPLDAWYDFYIFPAGDPAQRQVANLFRDISERIRAEQALRSAQELLVGIIDGTQELIAAQDDQFRYLAFNRSYQEEFTKVFGRHIEIGDSMVEALAHLPEDQQTAVLLWRRALGGESFKILQQFGDPRLERKWYELCFNPIRDSQGQVVAASHIIRDVTEGHQAEEALRHTQEQLQEHARILESTVEQRTAKLRETIADLEQFSYSISHDMRAPLRTMNSFSMFLLEEYGDRLDSTAADYLRRITSAAQRLDELIRDVLTYGQMAKADLALAPVDLDTLVAEIIEGYPDFQPGKVKIEVVHPLLPVSGCLPLLTQCVSNLLSNAVKFVAPGTVPAVRVWTQEHKPWVRLNVRDNGIGVNSAYLGKIWGVFQRAHHSGEYPGTGIGLSIVKRAVERMGGNVGVESQPGHGSTFWIELKKP